MELELPEQSITFLPLVEHQRGGVGDIDIGWNTQNESEKYRNTVAPLLERRLTDLCEQSANLYRTKVTKSFFDYCNVRLMTGKSREKSEKRQGRPEIRRPEMPHL